MKEMQAILDATVSRVCRDAGVDPDIASIDNRVGHVRVHVEKPDLPRWPMSMAPGPEYLSKDCPMDIDAMERILKVLLSVHRAMKEVHDRFDAPPPLWATAIHPMAKTAIGRSSYSFEDMVRESRSPTWRPEEHEEHLLGDKSGLHLEVKMLMFGSGMRVRTRGTFATIDVPRMPETTRTSIIGRRLAECTDLDDESAPLVISSAVDRADLEATRLTIWGDLVPIERAPEGENPWWVPVWSELQDLRMDRFSD